MATTPDSRPPRPSRPAGWGIPLAVSIAWTPFALLGGIASAGMGHGDYVAATILFPYTMLSTAWVGRINNLFVFVAVVQWPLYGLALSGALRHSRRFCLFAFLLLTMAHVVAVQCAFKDVKL